MRDFEQKGLSWLELAREFVLSLNQAEKLRNSEKYPEMKTFLKNIGSNHILQNQKLNFDWKIPYNLVAERSEANHQSLTFSRWCTILKIVRTFFSGRRRRRQALRLGGSPGSRRARRVLY